MTNSNDTSSSRFSDRSSMVKWLAAVIVVVMIVLMLLPMNLGGPPRDFGGPQSIVGATADGTRVTGSDRQYAVRLLELLDETIIDGSQRLASACWGPDVVDAFRKQPEALWLVLQESRRVGPGASPLTLGSLDPAERSDLSFGIFNSGQILADQLHALPASPMGQQILQYEMMQAGPRAISIGVLSPNRRTLLTPSQLPPMEQANLHTALNDFLTIQSAASLSTAAVKVTRPAVERLIAERQQIFRVQLARVDAAQFASQVNEPSDTELEAHFKSYAALAPGNVSPTNPFGFGYRLADRVAVEWITVDRQLVRQSIESTKTPYQWEVAAAIAFAKDPEAFASLATSQPATTAPTTSATVAPTTLAVPATTPSVTFDAVKDRAIAQQIDAATDARMTEIERRMRQSLTSEFQTYQVSKSTGAATQPTHVQVPVESSEYLGRVAAELEKQFKIPFKVERIATPSDRETINASQPSFARLERSLGGGVQQFGFSTQPATDYALLTAAAASTRPAVPAAQALSLFQPSETVTGPDGQTAIFRVIAAEPSRPADNVAPVREKVIADWKRAKAYELALASAKQTANAVRSGDAALTSLAGAVGAGEAYEVGAELPPPASIALDARAYGQFLQSLTDELLGGSASEPAVAAIGVPLADRVYVTRRLSIAPGWATSDALAMLRGQVRSQLSLLMSLQQDVGGNPYGLTPNGLGTSWLNVEDIYRRAGWTAARPD